MSVSGIGSFVFGSTIIMGHPHQRRGARRCIQLKNICIAFSFFPFVSLFVYFVGCDLPKNENENENDEDDDDDEEFEFEG